MKPVTNNSNIDNLSEKEYKELVTNCTKKGLICLEYHRRHNQQEQLQEITKSYYESFGYFLLKTKDNRGEIAFRLTKDMYTALAKELL